VKGGGYVKKLGVISRPFYVSINAIKCVNIVTVSLMAIAYKNIELSWYNYIVI
jgi:hypothetical protein